MDGLLSEKITKAIKDVQAELKSVDEIDAAVQLV